MGVDTIKYSTFNTDAFRVSKVYNIKNCLLNCFLQNSIFLLLCLRWAKAVQILKIIGSTTKFNTVGQNCRTGRLEFVKKSLNHRNEVSAYLLISYNAV